MLSLLVPQSKIASLCHYPLNVGFHTVRHKVLSLIESPRKAQKEAKLAAACMRGDL